jgi:hypothetical protein
MRLPAFVSGNDLADRVSNVLRVVNHITHLVEHVLTAVVIELLVSV